MFLFKLKQTCSIRHAWDWNSLESDCQVGVVGLAYKFCDFLPQTAVYILSATVHDLS